MRSLHIAKAVIRQEVTFCFISQARSVIGDNPVTSSIRIAQVFPDLVGKKTRALWKVYWGMLKYIINYALYLAHYMHIFI